MSKFPFSTEEEVASQADYTEDTGQSVSIAANAAAIALVDNGVFNVAAAANTETSTTGAISVSKLITLITSAGAESRTLAAPAANGRLKIIVFLTDGGDVTLASTNIDGGSGTFTFANANEVLILMSAGGKWRKLAGIASA